MSKKQEYEVVEMAIDAIKPSPDNPRKTFDAPDLEALKGSIEDRGLTEPILVRRADHTIIKGERRYRAEKLAGAKTLPVRVYDVDELTAGEMRLQGEAATPDREYEEALYKQWIDGSKAGRYGSPSATRPDQRKASIRVFARVIGQPYHTVNRIISAHEERVVGQLTNDVSYVDLAYTAPLAKKDPEARTDLLKQRDEITQREMEYISKAASDAPEDLRRKIARREVSVEDAKTTEVLETIAPEARRSLLAQRQAGTIDSKELTARVDALKEAPVDIRELIVKGELAPDVARTISKLPTAEKRAKFVNEVQIVRADVERQQEKHALEIEQAVDAEERGQRPEPTTIDVKHDIARVENDNWMVSTLNKLHIDALAIVRTDFLRKVSEPAKANECYWYIEDIANICQRIIAERSLDVRMIEKEGV